MAREFFPPPLYIRDLSQTRSKLCLSLGRQLLISVSFKLYNRSSLFMATLLKSSGLRTVDQKFHYTPTGISSDKGQGSLSSDGLL